MKRSIFSLAGVEISSRQGNQLEKSEGESGSRKIFGAV
jgi:hypothetical protein